jgi:excisionase family DNA binding protein
MSKVLAKSLLPQATKSPWLNPGQTAVYLGVDPLTVYNMTKDGRLKAYYLGNRVVRYHLDDINAALGRPSA